MGHGAVGSGWGSKPTWDGSHIHSKHIQGVWGHSYALEDGDMDSPSCWQHNTSWFRFGKSAEMCLWELLFFIIAFSCRNSINYKRSFKLKESPIFCNVYQTPTKKPRILHIAKFLRTSTHHKKYLFTFTMVEWQNLSTAPGDCIRQQRLNSLQRGDFVWGCVYISPKISPWAPHHPKVQKCAALCTRDSQMRKILPPPPPPSRAQPKMCGPVY